MCYRVEEEFQVKEVHKENQETLFVSWIVNLLDLPCKFLICRVIQEGKGHLVQRVNEDIQYLY
jgi:hypothetical protein